MDEHETHATRLLDRACDAREDAAALRAQSRQARRHAAELHAEANLILDTVEKLMARALEPRGFVLHAPVLARFRTTPSGSTGVDVVVRLEDAGRADAAKAVLDECFPDPLLNVTVS